MEDFKIEKAEHEEEELQMTVSPVCQKDGKNLAYISFTDGVRNAEGVIPDCKITSSSGFDEGEIAQLELYMKGNLSHLKQMAASVDVLKAIMGNEKE